MGAEKSNGRGLGDLGSGSGPEGGHWVAFGEAICFPGTQFPPL